MKVKRGLQLLRRKLLLEIDVHNWPGGMTASIGSAGCVSDHDLTTELVDRFLQCLLNAVAVVLALPANVIGAVIFDGELEACHASLVPAGTGNPRSNSS